MESIRDHREKSRAPLQFLDAIATSGTIEGKKCAENHHENERQYGDYPQCNSASGDVVNVSHRRQCEVHREHACATDNGESQRAAFWHAFRREAQHGRPEVTYANGENRRSAEGRPPAGDTEEIE